jgi:hypothetical protein
MRVKKSTEPVFVKLSRSPGIDSHPGGIDSSESFPVSLNVDKYRLCTVHCKDKIPKFRNKYSQKRNIGASVPISTFMRL